MRRFLSLALILALLAAPWLPASLAEAADDVSAPVEADVPLAESAGDTGLTVEGAEDAPAAEPAQPEAEPAPQPDPAGAEAQPAPEAIDPDTEADPAGELAVAAPETDAAEGITMCAAAVNIGLKESFALTSLLITPTGNALPALTWRSGDERFVKVDAATGVVTGVKKGSATIYVATADGQEAACKVNVLKAPGKLTVNPKKLTLSSDGQTAQMAFAVPKGSASNSFTFSSSNTNVAVVDENGLITTVGPGKATISVKAFNGKGGKCKLTVTPAPASIAFSVPNLSIAVGQRLTLMPTVTLSNGKTGATEITYSISPDSRDADCIKMDPATGKLEGVRKGSCVIIATTYNGKSCALPLTVAAAPTAISLTDDAVSIGVNDVYSGLLADLTIPEGETECASTITWSSSNKKVATVDDNGVITGKKKGSCVITAKTVNGLKSSCKVTVYKSPSRVALSPAVGSLKVGETGQYKISYPKGSGGTFILTSSDESVATIDCDGVVTAISRGVATITITTYNGKKATATLNVSSTDDVNLPTDDTDPVESDVSQYDENMTNAQKLEYVIYVAQSQLGKQYTYGGGYSKDENPSGFDCSGLVYWSFLHIGIKLQASAYRQGYDKSQTQITQVADLRRGDIVCFNTNESDADASDHTGIYLGKGKFIHASSSAKKVVISTLATGYYSRAFSWGRRVLD